MSKPSNEPETLAQAIEWDKVKSRYVRAGLCHKCAAQAAYGHQQGSGGFATIHPPCPDCAGIQLPGWLTSRNGQRGQKWLSDVQRVKVPLPRPEVRPTPSPTLTATPLAPIPEPTLPDPGKPSMPTQRKKWWRRLLRSGP